MKKHSTKSDACCHCGKTEDNVHYPYSQYRETRESSIISYLSVSTTTLDDLGFRCSLETICTLLDEDIREKLDNLYNEEIERQNSL